MRVRVRAQPVRDPGLLPLRALALEPPGEDRLRARTHAHTNKQTRTQARIHRKPRNPRPIPVSIRVGRHPLLPHSRSGRSAPDRGSSPPPSFAWPIVTPQFESGPSESTLRCFEARETPPPPGPPTRKYEVPGVAGRRARRAGRSDPPLCRPWAAMGSGRAGHRQGATSAARIRQRHPLHPHAPPAHRASCTCGACGTTRGASSCTSPRASRPSPPSSSSGPASTSPRSTASPSRPPPSPETPAQPGTPLLARHANTRQLPHPLAQTGTAAHAHARRSAV